MDGTQYLVHDSTWHTFAYLILGTSLQGRDYYLLGKDEQSKAQGSCENLPKITQLIHFRVGA